MELSSSDHFQFENLKHNASQPDPKTDSWIGGVEMAKDLIFNVSKQHQKHAKQPKNKFTDAEIRAQLPNPVSLFVGPSKQHSKARSPTGLSSNNVEEEESVISHRHHQHHHGHKRSTDKNSQNQQERSVKNYHKIDTSQMQDSTRTKDNIGPKQNVHKQENLPQKPAKSSFSIEVVPYDEMTELERESHLLTYESRHDAFCARFPKLGFGAFQRNASHAVHRARDDSMRSRVILWQSFMRSRQKMLAISMLVEGTGVHMGLPIEGWTRYHIKHIEDYEVPFLCMDEDMEIMSNAAKERLAEYDPWPDVTSAFMWNVGAFALTVALKHLDPESMSILREYMENVGGKQPPNTNAPASSAPTNTQKPSNTTQRNSSTRQNQQQTGANTNQKTSAPHLPPVPQKDKLDFDPHEWDPTAILDVVSTFMGTGTSKTNQANNTNSSDNSTREPQSSADVSQSDQYDVGDNPKPPQTHQRRARRPPIYTD